MSPDRDHSAYRDFIRRSAAELLDVPDSVLTLLGGSKFRALRPELYQKVRQGGEFGLTEERVYADLTAACAQQRRSLSRRMDSWLFRSFRWVVVALRLLWFVGIVSPLWRRKMLGPPMDTLLSAADSPPSSLGGQPPRASIVILSYNRLSCLRTTIAALLATVGDTPCELIVVDNGSRDGSVEFLRDCHGRGLVSKLLLLPENEGISAGYNHGFAAADERSEYLMKLDSDIKILSFGWLAEAIDFLSANRDVGFVAFNQVNHPMLRLLPSLSRGGRELMDYADWTVGSAMIVPRQVHRQLGCFIEDAELKYVPDDIDYYVRASRMGYRVFFLKQVLVYHQSGFTGGKRAATSALLAIRLAGEYDRGVRGLAVRYEKYAPGNAR